jgi:hypothetical protein
MSSMRVSAPLFTNTACARRASSTATLKGGANRVGMVVGSVLSFSVSMRSDFAYSLSISTPRDRYCQGFQSMSMSSAVISEVSVRNTRRPMCMWPYREPDTPLKVSLPPLAPATRWAIICRVVSRPRYQTAPPRTTAVTATPIATRRGQRRWCGTGCVSGVSGVELSTFIRR